MTPQETHRAIQTAFRFRGRDRNLPWYPRRGRREHLAELFAQLGFTSGVEVGTQIGLHAMVLCKANPNLRLTCVDPWQAYFGASEERQRINFEKAKQNLATFANCELVKGYSLEIVQKFFNNELDFVYIDGNHLFDYAIRDIIEWSPKVKRGGIVAVHDYHPWVGNDVKLAIDSYTAAHDIRPWYVTRELHPTAYWVRE